MGDRSERVAETNKQRDECCWKKMGRCDGPPITKRSRREKNELRSIKENRTVRKGDNEQRDNALK